MMRSALRAAVCVTAVHALGACDRQSSRGHEEVAASATGSAAATTSTAALPPPAAIPDESARRAVYAWSSALDRHDVDGLAPLYADRVRFYGKDLTRDAVLSRKQDALRAQPTFRQEIVGPIDLQPADPGEVAARFTKRSGAAKRMRITRARVVLGAGAGGVLRVVEESDEEADKPSAAPSHRDLANCEGTTAKLVQALPQVKKAVAEAMAAAAHAGPDTHFGSITPVEDDDGFTVELGIDTPDRFEASVFYSVDAAGAVSVTVEGEDIAVPAHVARAVRAACAP
jgi:hypothetical protein